MGMLIQKHHANRKKLGNKEISRRLIVALMILNAISEDLDFCRNDITNDFSRSQNVKWHIDGNTGFSLMNKKLLAIFLELRQCGNGSDQTGTQAKTRQGHRRFQHLI